ncbi:hypothetical protein UFOVP961_66 [uncultured Caudovirales phage]|uniref:Uncharacterized protein n=1 Tax=uncultured Caudovirales phage TaxID=2100421 RepID=A0A6J7XJQ0_9CAUD|nr:hypothetical protein UFOVP961_66 [uncultured Caudovirales phage]CAB4185754.1 hypothetical protein UFOVP1123_136 [uncultured Caudovirales phage]CAB4193056.1 hypothetical protein UFOVP1239_15 [uncultured Caudovirales phage]CAB4216238.1 hypothetical protein UFOVP1484_140 [uncultured Caudovirales phage]CAB5230468.1 hypothetical protein UFOVP1577_4 [uncultured Caudovirales phage]
MNIFYLDKDIDKCVQAHCDKHVVKMILEYAQLLSSVHHMTDPKAEQILCLYKLTHKNHPDAVWARSSLGNYEYLYSLAILLGEEYTYRYNRVHKSIYMLEDMPYPSYLPEGKFTEPPKCVHDDFKNIEDTVEAYRSYYNRDKAHFCVWTNRSTPEWFSPTTT